MTPQEIFNTVAEHLFTQGEQAKDANGSCQYRGPRGTTCAVGRLLPDDVYSSRMEGVPIGSLVIEFDDVLPSWVKDNEDLLTDLQHTHDQPHYWDSTEDMQHRLKSIARARGLSVRGLSKLSFKDR